MTVIGLDDTDSRTSGGCTTSLAARLAEGIRTAGGTVARALLVRLNPAVPYKTRGNAALALHCDLAPGEALDLVADAVAAAETDDPRTNPGAVVAPVEPGAVPEARAGAGAVPEAVAHFASRAVTEHLEPTTARRLLDEAGFATRTAGNGRGLVGALAAVGAWRARGGATGDWTHECVTYRERERWGTTRAVDRESVFAVAERYYPRAWDTVDRVEGTAVCVPRTPCPVLFGVRGDDRATVRAVADAVESEPVARRHTFLTNQGTDDHLREGCLGDLRDGRAYRVDGTVVTPPATREGGHVFLEVGPGEGAVGSGLGTAVAADGGDPLRCAAFEPTKRFRDRVRALRPGDRVTVCGEVGEGTLKLEKFAVRDRVETERTTPTCPGCERRMESAGADQGYRCRDCGTSAAGPAERPLDRDLEPGWYEVPPVARRHIAKPLIRGGFDGPTHPER